MRRKFLNTSWIAVGLFVCALLIRVVILFMHPFDGLYGQDAFAYYRYARQLWDSTLQLHPPAPFYWPLGYPTLIAIAFLFSGFSPLAGQSVSIISGALIAPLIFLLVREVAPTRIPAPPQAGALRARQGHALPRTVGEGRGGWGVRGEAGPLLAGLIAAVSGQLLQLSISVMSDAPAVMWSLMSALALVRYTRTLKLRWLLLTSLTLAFALLTRLVYGTLFLPWALACLVTWPRNLRTLRISRRVVLQQLAAAALIPLPLFISQAGALMPSDSINHAWLVGWNPVHAFTRVFNNADGHFEYALPVGVFYAQPIAHPYYIFPLFTPLIVVGLWAIRRAPLTTRIILIGWLAVAYAFLMGIPYENFRFGLTLWPPLLVLLGVGFDVLWQNVNRRQKTDEGAALPSVSGPLSPVNLHGALLILACLGLLGMLFWSERGLQPFFAAKDENLAVVRWTESQVPNDGALLTMGLTEYFNFYAPRLQVVELYNQTPDTLAQFNCTQHKTVLLVDMESIETQWANREPERNVRWLRTHVGLSEIGRSGVYTLYRVGGACN